MELCGLRRRRPARQVTFLPGVHFAQVYDTDAGYGSALTGQPCCGMEQPVLGGQTPQQDTMYGSRKSRLHQTESKLSAHMDSEDKRVKELTEGILYDFLPASLNVMLPRCEDPLQELDADRCRAVASAALAVSALMNAPPGFLEFLLCVPWRKLSQLYPKSDSIDKLVSNLQVTDEERRKLVNTRIDSSLMATVLDFLYKEKHADSVPPMLQLTPINPLQPEDKSDLTVSRETVAAVLDGATPLHCAALRGNPAQVDHLLYCGADPSVRTAAGELPIELVPVCGDRAGSAPGRRTCRCMAPNDQEVWECRSRQARNLIARRCFLSFSVGLFSWVRLVFFCLLCMLGQAGCYTSISRPVVERHIDTRRQQKVAAARARAHALVTRMRAEAEAGHVHLVQAKRECMESTAFQRGPPDISQICFTDPTKSPPPPPPQISQIHDINLHLQESGTSSTGEELASEKAFKCFVRSVHALQSLELHGDTVPQVFAELVQAGAAESRDTHVLEDEQADLYSCWAESVLLKFRGCTCPGCAALAIQAVRMAHIQATRLFGKMDRVRQTHADRWRAVGEALARVVYVHICLLLETEAQASPTRSLVWRAEQCLREWDRLEKAGLTQAAGVLDPRHVAALQRWTKTADSDLYLAEALHGQSLPHNKTLQEVVLSAVSYSIDGAPILARPVSSEVVASLEQAITLASLPSPLLAHIARGVVANATAELAAAARLRELVGAKGAALGGGGTAEAVAALTLALHDAEPFRSRLGPELEAAMELHSKWTHRLSAVEKLESAVEEVRAYIAAYPLSFSLETAVTGPRAVSAAVGVASSSPQARAGAALLSGSGPLTGSGGGGPGVAEVAGMASPGATASGAMMEEGGTGASGGGSAGEGTQAPDFAEWERRMKQLELAMNDAKDANVSVTKAKRLHKEMAAVAAAAEASRQLEAVMARRPSGPLQLKLALNKAEAAASALSGLGGAPVPGVADVLNPLMAAARRRLDTERAAEALSKAAASYRTLADLARLEAAIYNAKKIGAEELDPESYRTSCELRAHLQDAARARASLEAALRTLQTQLRQEDAEALERVLQDASKWEDLLVADIAKARKSLEHWRNMTVCDAKLGRLLREGATTAVLARAIQEAAATGVKVQHAKRILKLMQALEAVMAATVDGGAAERYALVKAKLDAAEQGGVTGGPLPEAARRNLARLAAITAREALEAALKPHSDWSTAQRISALREALDKAESALGQGRATGDGSIGSAANTAPGGAGEKAGGGDVSQTQQHQAKLVNGSTTGKTSRRKRSSGGGVWGGVTGGGESQTKQDDAVGSAPPAAPTQADGITSVLTNGNSNESMALIAAVDDDILNAVHELARKARQVLEEDQAELARIERERQEAERARKEAQEREQQERLRQEQERQKREKAEAAERKRALAEKREKAKAEAKARHHQNAQQHSQQYRGRSATGEQMSTMGTGVEKAVNSGKATGGRGGGKAAHSGAAAQATTSGRSSASGARPSAAHRDTQLPASQPGSSQSVTSTIGQAKGELALARAASVPSPTSSWRPTPPAPLTASSIRVFEAAAVKAAGNGDYRLPPGGPVKATAAAIVVHTRGDSLESLGEVVHKLNREVIEALDLDCESGVPDQGVVAMNDGSGGNAGIGGGAGGTSSSAISASGGTGTCDDVSSACGTAGCFPSLDDGTVGGGGGGCSSARSCSGAAGTFDSILDRTPSHHTSIMSSIASADDVILQGCAGIGICMGSTPLGASTGTGALVSGICLSSISMGPPGTTSYSYETAPSSLPCRLGAQAAMAGVEGGLLSSMQNTVGSTASGGNSSSGAALPLTKPRFGVGDLGGASWGLDSPLLSSTPGTAALFPSIAEFGMLSAAKVDTAAGGTAVSGPPTASGWSAGTAGASAGHGVVVYGSGPMGQAGVPMAAHPGTGGALDEGGLAGGIAGRPHGVVLQSSVTGVGSGGGVLSGPGALGGLGTRAGDPGIPGSGLTHGSLSSPRTTVATANANVQGLLQVRPLGPGSAPATGLTLAHLQGGIVQGGGGRPSLQLQLQAPQPVLQPQGTGAGNGILARSGFWTPPAYQASMELSPDGTGLAASAGGPSGGSMQLGLPPGSAGVQVMEWQHHQQQGDLQPAGLHVLHIGSSSMPGAAGTGPQILRAAPVGTSVNRICRFYLQGYCRDGERCRFAHTVGGMPNQPANGGASTVPGAVQLLQLGPSTAQNAHPQLLAAGTGFATSVTGAPGVGAGLTATHVTQSSAVGSFAFGAPGAEAFAPLGTGSLSRSSASSIGEPPRLEHLQPKTHVAQQLRHVAGMVYAGGSGSGGVGVGYPGLPPNGGGFIDRVPLGSSVGGGGGGMLGPHQQSVQLRDSATGATFSAILTVGGNPNGSSQRNAHPQQLVLQLPEDLTFSPPSSASTPSSMSGPGTGQTRK